VQFARMDLVDENASSSIEQEKRSRLHRLPEPWTEGSEPGDEGRTGR
jgi:hypothetical protein